MQMVQAVAAKHCVQAEKKTEGKKKQEKKKRKTEAAFRCLSLLSTDRQKGEQGVQNVQPLVSYFGHAKL